MTRARQQGAISLSLKESIAFYPTAIALGLLSLAIVTVYLESLGASDFLHERVSYLIVRDGDVGRAILTTLVVGMISLTVFSFTMVMQVLNRATVTFSPRVLPGLITHRANQKILGFYLGVIIYGLVIMMSERSGTIDIPGLGTLLFVVLGVASLGLFVYFIHSISTSIQVDSILEGLSRATHRQLSKMKDTENSQRQPAPVEAQEWRNIISTRSGFVQEIHEGQMVRLMNKHDACLRMLVPLGCYVVKNTSLCQSNRELDEATRALIIKAFVFHREEQADINYVHGLVQITEIAVAALSPSRNDHGTATRAMALLTDLLAERMYLPDEEYIHNERHEVRITLVWPSFDDLLHRSLGSIRSHAGKDTGVFLKLLDVVRTLLILDKDGRTKHRVLVNHARSIVEDAAREIDNTGDVVLLNSAIAGINQLTASPDMQLEEIGWLRE